MSFWTKKIINISGDVVGLEINDLSVRAIQLEKAGSKNRVIGYGAADIAPDSISEGEIIKKENVVLAISNAISNASPQKIRAKKAICSISETKAFLRIVNIPKMKKEEIGEAIKWELEANIPLTIDQVYYDWQVLDQNFSKENNKMSILVVAAARKVIDQLVDAVETAGLKVIDVGIESIAQSRSLISEKEAGKTILIIDIGGRRTSFLIAIGNTPCFTSSIPLSSGSITSAIARELGVKEEEAERMKLNYGIGSINDNNAIFKAANPILESFVSEIEKTIDFYLNSLGYSSSIDKIIACGGGANTKGLIPYLMERIHREIEIGNPWINFNMEGEAPDVIEKDKIARYATVIGLALKGAYYENFS